MINMTHSLTL